MHFFGCVKVHVLELRTVLISQNQIRCVHVSVEVLACLPNMVRSVRRPLDRFVLVEAYVVY